MDSFIVIYMRKKKDSGIAQLAVKIPASLDRAIEMKCAREGMLKREFVALACRKLLEATNA